MPHFLITITTTTEAQVVVEAENLQTAQVLAADIPVEKWHMPEAQTVWTGREVWPADLEEEPPEPDEENAEVAW